MDVSIEALKEAVRGLHGCDSRFVEAVSVEERTASGAVVWSGTVHVFDLIEHPSAKRAYAWSHATEGERRRFVAVLAVPPITTPQKAVQAAVVAEARAQK